jgi:hypothetical protein
MTYFKKIFLAVSLLLVSQLAHANWPQPKGKAFVKLGQSWTIARQHFTDTGKLDPNTTFASYFTSFYGEYGLTDRITGIVYAPLFSRSLFNSTVSGTTGEILLPGEAINGLGDINIAARYAIIPKGKFVLSTSLLLGLPTGIDDGGTAGNLQTGDGEFNQMVRLEGATSKQLGKVNSYYKAYVGFNNRTQGFSDEFHYGLEGGVELKKNKSWFILRAIGVESFKNGELPSASNGTSLFANNAAYLSLSPEISYNLGKNWGVSASVAGAVRGRIIFAAPMYAVGIHAQL